MKWVSLLMLLSISVVISGCGDNPEEEKFRQDLIEKALNDEVRKNRRRVFSEQC